MRGLPTLLSLTILLLYMSLAMAGPADWPAPEVQHKPGTYFWWHGSAVDEANLTAQLEAFQAAGLGGVHIVPIYGAKGYEDRYVEYLSPRWMELLSHAVREAERLGMWVDMTTGTGWNFGGPSISGDLACAVVRSADLPFPLKDGLPVAAEQIQAATAYGPEGDTRDVTDLARTGELDLWIPPEDGWRCAMLWQEATNRMVERAAPGGEGPMLNPLSGEAVWHYLSRFDAAFAGGARWPRAVYHDSYEYHGNNWVAGLLDTFESLQGYRLQDNLQNFLGNAKDETRARLKHDYRETVSTMMLENFLVPWQRWAVGHGCLSRNQAHGSPGNLLDFYAAADIPETEMFRRDRDPLMAKFAASAAHVTGKRLVSCETGTWLAEHFTVTLADLKDLIDEQFASGVNHLFYHGTCYSPADAPWPGWLFYASTQMNPRNAIWHDAPVLNAYIARCQSLLQAGTADSDALLYWPVHDLWQNAEGLAEELSVHRTAWLTDQPMGPTARWLWEKGYDFDYISDRMLQRARTSEGEVFVDAGAGYKCVLVPPCELMPENTMAALVALAEAGATVLFQGAVPRDVPGLGNLEQRRSVLKTQCRAGSSSEPTGYAWQGRVKVWWQSVMTWQRFLTGRTCSVKHSWIEELSLIHI